MLNLVKLLPRNNEGRSYYIVDLRTRCSTPYVLFEAVVVCAKEGLEALALLCFPGSRTIRFHHPLYVTRPPKCNGCHRSFRSILNIPKSDPFTTVRGGRQALEPLTQMAKEANLAVLGLIHVNKSAGADPLTSIMGSRAFTAVPRAVLVAIKDPQNEAHNILGLEKSNLGPTISVTSYVYEIVAKRVAGTDEDPIITSVVHWLGDSECTVKEAMGSVIAGEDSGAVVECAAWLEDYLTIMKGPVDSKNVKKAGRSAGHSDSSLQRARKRLGIEVVLAGYPRQSTWDLPRRGTPPK